MFNLTHPAPRTTGISKEYATPSGIRSCLSCFNQSTCLTRNVIHRKELNSSRFDYISQEFLKEPTFQENLAITCAGFKIINDPIFR
jgi:hypothetical protein